MAEQLLVDVSYRDILLFSRAVIDGVEGECGFLPTSAPMPVGSELKLRSLRDGEISTTAKVTDIVETRRKMRNPGEGTPDDPSERRGPTCRWDERNGRNPDQEAERRRSLSVFGER